MIAASDATTLISDRLVSLDGGTPHLLGGRCTACEALNFPRADVCPKCLCMDVEQIELSSEGTLYSYSIVHQAPKGWKIPYALGYVDLPEGIRVLAHLDATASELAMDQRVRLSHSVVGTTADGQPLSTYTFTPV